ncbi:uncharacterized protein (DUF2147 family) [Silvibacterium bohemicum]|uniref:Uncharacterized protein (DUF2147 family) n=1 Tax=Silvibacterium bohemicum TaxID=1577686 RepID=A0A841K1B7_9BACT|nr:DUF2147 domain-containing protein [Silvibacterium bohemicum]MBB6147346.1 uncharacterized protein (DUF2147 family) [Silvibacterium bohemicum]
MKISVWFGTFLAIYTAPLLAANNTMIGNWITPDHSVVTVYPCGEQTLCTKLVWTTDRIAKDDKNPDERLRKRPLCGIQIGAGFVITDPSHAKDGKIYDPDSGKTYSATMVTDDSGLKLHGYIGVSLFGRTEVWHRTQEHVAVCVP